jgi:hypothetical protein
LRGASRVNNAPHDCIRSTIVSTVERLRFVH